MAADIGVTTGGDAVAILMNDHQRIKSLFDDLLDADGLTRPEIFERLTPLLVVHNATEENIVYPALHSIAQRPHHAKGLLSPAGCGSDRLLRSRDDRTEQHGVRPQGDRTARCPLGPRSRGRGKRIPAPARVDHPRSDGRSPDGADVREFPAVRSADRPSAKPATPTLTEKRSSRGSIAAAVRCYRGRRTFYGPYPSRNRRRIRPRGMPSSQKRIRIIERLLRMTRSRTPACDGAKSSSVHRWPSSRR